MYPYFFFSAKKNFLGIALNFHLILCWHFQVIRRDTAMDQLKAVVSGGMGDVHKESEKALLGQIVMTKYNNKTYRYE
jgi:hypothetical protein